MAGPAWQTYCTVLDYFYDRNDNNAEAGGCHSVGVATLQSFCTVSALQLLRSLRGRDRRDTVCCRFVNAIVQAAGVYAIAMLRIVCINI